MNTRELGRVAYPPTNLAITPSTAADNSIRWGKVLSVRKAEGLTIAQVSTRFCVGIATVTRWLKRIEPQLTRIKPATKIDRIVLARDVREHPDAYHGPQDRTAQQPVREEGNSRKHQTTAEQDEAAR